jgi:hypothetical protein
MSNRISENSIIDNWLAMLDNLEFIQRTPTGEYIQKQLVEKGYLEFIHSCRSYINVYGIEASSKIIALPYAVDFLFHKKDPDYLKASWYSFIEFMRAKNGLKSIPNKISTDKRELRFYKFLMSLRKDYKNNNLTIDIKREILRWPKGREWVKWK